MRVSSSRIAAQHIHNVFDSICYLGHSYVMEWEVGFDPAFDPEFDALPTAVQDELLAQAKLLEAFGPALARPRVDTLKGSRHANMKELRFQAENGVWRVAFDPRRKAILLVAGEKSGVNEKRFYRRLIGKADARFETHLDRLKNKRRSG